MAARFWWLVAALELALAAWLAACLAGWWRWPPILALLLVPPALGALKCALIGISFGIARTERRSCVSGAVRISWLSGFWRECQCFTRVEWRMCLEPFWPMRNIEEPGAERKARPVLLLHGVACNRAIWRPLLERLRAAGFGPVRAIDLEPLFCDLDAHVIEVQRALRQLQFRSGGQSVSIVAHSMGGLVARSLLRHHGAGLVERLVTIGTPHHGTRLARWLPMPALRQMRPDSAWLQRLNADPASTSVPLLCIYSLEDNLVAPADSAALAGARCQALRAIGHLEMLQANVVLERVLAELSSGSSDAR